jgi:hypothetical protein
MIGAQMTQFARPENARWIVDSDVNDFVTAIREQSADGSVPADSRGVPGSIYQANIDVPLAMREVNQ